MKNLFLAVALIVLLAACNNTTKQETIMTLSEELQSNPLVNKAETPYGVPDFENIKVEHFQPAVEYAIDMHNKEIAEIVDNKDKPTFENTLEAYDNSGIILGEIASVLSNLQSANTSEELKKVAKDLSPLFSKHSDDTWMNAAFFAKVSTIYEQKDGLDLDQEQMMFLQKVYERFVRGGANLNGDAQDRFREINEKLSVLSLDFGDHVLADNNAFEMIIENEEDLDGLPESVRNGAKASANENGYEGNWLFTADKPSMIPFLTYSAKRDLRETIMKGYISRGDLNNKNDNNEIILKMVKLRDERAKLLGFENHASYILDINMAKEPTQVYALIQQVWDAALPVAKKELEALQTLATKEGADFEIAPWDWWYYAEKLRKEKYDLDEEQLRPYFELENVKQGIFTLCNNLYDIQFEKVDVPVYHQDAMAYEVKEADGSHIGILYMDFHPRASKRGGAWMTEYRGQSRRNGEMVHPVISIVCNFSKPGDEKPSLLSFEEVETFFHEFGHALHGLLSDVKYNYLAGTSVSRDFVELPSQIMENWAGHPELLKIYAKHYKTGEVIPQELVDKIEKSSLFNQGFVAVEYLSACFLDMDWHTADVSDVMDVAEFEKISMDKIGLLDEIVVRYKSPYFQHIFAGGYSSGYYGYIWAEVLDADAFEAFKENGVFDKTTATAFRSNVLEKGGTVEPMELYKAFRGKEPSVDPMLRRKGLS